MSKINKLLNRASVKTGLVLTSALGAMSASATGTAGDHTAAITSAFDQAESNANTGVVGLVGLVAIVCGVGLLISLFKRA